MGTYQQFRCDQCGFELWLGGREEFYRDETGERQVYGHPLPVSDEARRAGIHGQQMREYCTACRLQFTWVLMEFAHPADYPAVFAATARPTAEYLVDPDEGLPDHPEQFTFKAQAPACPQCGSSVTLLSNVDSMREMFPGMTDEHALETFGHSLDAPCPNTPRTQPCPGQLHRAGLVMT